MPVNYGSLQFKEAIKFYRDKLRLPTAAWTDLWEGMHARAFVVAGAMRDELLTDLQSAVGKAIEQGTTLEQFRKEFDQIVQRHGWSYRGGRNWRTRVIYDTNLRTAYQAGRFKQMQQVVETRPYWRYRHNDAVEHPRPLHQAWDNLVLRHDDAWWRTHYPPNGWGCRCYVETLSERDLDRMGISGPDQAPPLQLETKEVGIRGPSPRTVEVPKGIDPGWGYNVGEAAWGHEAAERLAAEYVGGKNWIRLTPGDWASYGRPEHLPPQPMSAKPGPRLASREAMAAEIARLLGGAMVDYTLPTAAADYPVRIDAGVLARHLPLDRSPFLPLLPQVLQSPQEVWLSFERHRDSGRIALRVRAVSVIKGEKGRGYLLVLDAQKGHLVGWSFMPYENRRVRKLRRGKLLYAE